LFCFFINVILDKPIKGQAYRSLEFNKSNDYCDKIVAKICQKLGFTPNLLGIRHDLTLWIDPCEVTIRFVLLRCSYSISYSLRVQISLSLLFHLRICVGRLRRNKSRDLMMSSYAKKGKE